MQCNVNESGSEITSYESMDDNMEFNVIKNSKTTEELKNAEAEDSTEERIEQGNTDTGFQTLQKQ